MAKPKDINDLVNEYEDAEEWAYERGDQRCPKCGSKDADAYEYNHELKIISCTECPAWVDHH